MIEECPEEDIRSWKRKHGKVFSASMAGVDFIFRALTFAEYDSLLQVEESDGSAEAEDSAVSMGVLFPLDMDFENFPAGVVSSLSEEILEISGFGSAAYAKQLLEAQRVNVADVRGLMKSFVLATMPAYKEEELDQLTFDQMSKKVALAEQILKVHQATFGVDNDVTLDLIDPKEEAMKQQEEAKKHSAQKKPGQAGFNDPIAQKLASALQ